MDINKTTTRQAHGLTHAEMEKVHQMQINDEVPMTKANNAGKNIQDPYFKEEYADYELPEFERHLYHVAVESRNFTQTGAVPQKLSTSTVQKFTPQAYKFQEEHNYFKGLIVHILHNPEFENVEGRKKPNTKTKEEETEVQYLSTEEMEAMTVAELKDYYIEVTGEEKAPSSGTKAELIGKIEDAVTAQKQAAK